MPNRCAVARIVLACRRRKELEDDEHFYDGHIDVLDAPESYRAFFRKHRYSMMMSLFAKYAVEHPTAQLFMMALEQEPIPEALEIEPALCHLLREDPVSFIRALSPPRRYVSLRDPVPTSDRLVVEQKAIRQRPIRAGYETLADAFGETIYISVRVDIAECPGCGRWSAYVHRDRVTCRCGFSVGGVFIDAQAMWFAVSADELLQAEDKNGLLVRFFLPQRWNERGAWITRDDLIRKLKTFKEEKRCSQPTHDPQA